MIKSMIYNKKFKFIHFSTFYNQILIQFKGFDKNNQINQTVYSKYQALKLFQYKIAGDFIDIF